MTRKTSWVRLASGLLPLLSIALLHCAGFGEEGLGAAACPELRGAQSAIGASFTADARANAKVGAFVQASKDLLNVSLQIEAEATEACLRMGHDLGMSPAELSPRDGPGGRASGACGAVGARIDAIMRQGVRVRVMVTPPQCQANASATAQCQGACGGAVNGPSADAECQGSCKAHADVQASCSPALVNAQVSQGAEMAARLAATLQANLPLLLHAELALGRRLASDVQLVGQIGGQMPHVVGNAGARALACVAAAADATASASVRVNVSVQASASVSGRVGG